MDSSLLATLRIHNPWLDRPKEQKRRLAERRPKNFIGRQQALEIRPGRAELVVGSRQAGKSTWILDALARQDDPILILHAEEPHVRELADSPALALEQLADVLGPKTIVLLEEVQHLPEAPLFLKGWVDLEPRRRIIATGSSSFTFQARHRESLAGRTRRTRLLPFSLAEVGAEIPAGLAPAIREARLAESWRRLVVTGGFPAAWLSEDPATTLHYLAESVVVRDVSDFHTVERPSAFRKLLELAAADVGNLVNLSHWANVAQTARGTVVRYLELMEEAHVLKMVPPFVGGRRAEITGTPKVYFVDNGMRNALFGGFTELADRSDRGALWENAVHAELLKRLRLLDEILFWRSKAGAEVDFVVRRRGEIVAIETKAGALGRPKLSRAGRSFIDAYRPRCFGVLNAGLRDDEEVDGVPVLYRRPWEIEELLGWLGE